MFGYFIQFQCLDMCQGLRVNKAGNRFLDGARTCIDDHIGPAQLTNRPVEQPDFQCLGANEAPGAEDEFRSAFL